MLIISNPLPFTPSEEQKSQIEKPKRETEYMTSDVDRAEAHEALTSFVCVSFISGKFMLSDHSDQSSVMLVSGVSVDNFGPGDLAEAMIKGQFYKSGHGLEPGKTIFLNGASGEISTTPPSTGWSKILGYVKDQDHICIDVGERPMKL